MATNTSKLNVEINAKDHASKTIKGLQSTIIRFVGAVSAALSTFAAVILPARQAADFDLALANVAKTTGFTASEMDSLALSLNDMSRELAVSQTQLAGVAAIAGQLGLGNKGKAAVEEFTRSVARASITLGLAEEEVASFGAQILTVFDIDTDNIENVFSMINELSNNSVADARSLLDIMLRVGNIAGVTAEEAAALAATMKDLGVQTEVAGTSMVRGFANMEAKAKDFADLMGTSQAEWIELLEYGATDALKAVLTQLNGMDKVARTGVMKKLFGEGRQLATYNKLLGDAGRGFKVLDAQLARSKQSFKEGQSSIEEYNRVVGAFKNQLLLMSNAVRNLAIKFGDKLLKALEDTIQKLQEFFADDQVAQFIDELADSVAGIVTYLADFVENIILAKNAAEDFFDTLSLIAGILISSAFLSLAKTMAGWVGGIGKVVAGWGAAAKSVNTYTTALRQAAVASKEVVAAQAATAVQAASVAVQGRGATGLASVASLQAAQKAMGKYNAEIQKNIVLETARVTSFKKGAALLRKEHGLELSSMQRGTQAYKIRSKELQAIRREQQVLTNEAIANEAKLQAAIKNGTVVQKKAAIATTGVGRAAITAGAAIKGFARTAATVFGRILGVITGPLGTIALTLYLFKDEITQVMGNLFGGEDAKAKQKADLEAQGKKARAAAKKEVDAFVSYISGLGDAVDLDMAFNYQGEGKLADYFKNATAALKEFQQAVLALKGADVLAASLQEQETKIIVSVKSMQRQIEEYQKEIDATGQHLRRLGENSQFGKKLADDIKKAEVAIRVLQSEVDDANADLERNAELQEKLVTGMTQTAERAGALINSVSQGVTQAFISWAEQYATQRKEEEKLTESKKQLAAAEAEYQRLVKEGASGAKLEDAFNEVERLKAGFQLLEWSVEEATEAASALEKEVVGLDKIKLDATKMLATDGVAEVNKQIKIYGEHNLGRTLKEESTAFNARLISVTKNIAVNEKLLDSFKKFRAPIDATISTIKGIYDNMAKSIAAAKKTMDEFSESIRANLAARREDAAYNKAEEAINKATRKAIDDVRDSYAKRIANAKKLGKDQTYIRSLEKERDAAIEAIKANDKRKKSMLEGQHLMDEAARLNDRASNAVDDYRQALEEVQRKEAQGQYAEGEEGAKQRIIDMEKLIQKQTAAKKANKEYTDSIEEMSKFSDEDVLGQPIISDAYVNENAENAGKVQDDYLDIFAGSEVTVKKSTGAITKVLDGVQAGIKGVITAAKDEIKALNEIVPGTKTVADNMVKVWTGALTQIEGTYEEIAEKIKNQESIAQNLEFGLTKADAEKLLSPFNSFGKDANARFIKGFKDAGEISAALNAFLSNIKLSEDTAIEVPLNPDMTKLVADINTHLAKTAAEGNSFYVPISPASDTREKVGGELIKDPFDIDLKVKNLDFNGANTTGSVNVGGMAAGGYVSGPGTATSDSILSRLSNGEYVSDAFTTKFFGAGFFDALKSIAKSGLKSFKMPALDLPGYAGGGLVSAPQTMGEVVTLNLSLGGQTFTLGGQREQVRGLVAAMKSVSR